MFPRGPVPEIESDSPDCCQHLQVQTSITAPAHIQVLTVMQAEMTEHLRNSTGTKENARRDDRKLGPRRNLMQAGIAVHLRQKDRNTSRDDHTIVLRRNQHQCKQG